MPLCMCTVKVRVPLFCYDLYLVTSLYLNRYSSPAMSRYLDTHLLLHPSTWIHLSYYTLYLDTYPSSATSLYLDTPLILHPVPGYPSPATSL